MPRTASQPKANTNDIRVVEEALTALVRRARLPRTQQRLMERAGIAIDPALYGVLARVDEHEPLRLTELAQHLAIDTSTASRQAAQLERLGLVTRDPDPDDGRASALALSPEGRKILNRVRRARGEAMTELLGAWSSDDLASLASLLTRLIDDITQFTADT